jgi:hypothetical protein
LLLIDADIIVYQSVLSRGVDFLLAIDYAENSLYKILNRFPNSDYDLYLTGKNNFRKKVAEYYKAQRPKDKPRYFTELRDYLVSEWGAIVTEGNEADDEIGKRHDTHTVIVSTDKDFKTIPGNIYDFKKDEMFHVTEQQATTNFWVQCLTGDTADNIPGVKNPAKAHHKNPPNFTDNTAREYLTVENQREVVENVFKLQYGDAWEQKFDEIATLLFIQRKDTLTYKECNLLYPLHV